MSKEIQANVQLGKLEFLSRDVSEDVSEQKNLSRNFHTKINILYFLSQTLSTKIILARKGTSS